MTANIVIEVSGVSVVGAVVERSPFDLEVALIEPHGGLQVRHSSHIPAFAQRYQTFVGEGGDQRARDLLSEAYESVRYAVDYVAELRLRWRTLYAQVDGRSGSRIRSEGDLSVARAESRKLLRSGTITAEQHQRAVGLATEELREWSTGIENAVDELWDDTPVSPSSSLRHQLMRLVDPTWPQEDAE